MINSGRLFVFEGADGSGKSAVSTAFAQFLRTQGLAAQLIPFPGKTPGTIGELVYRIHHQSNACGVKQLTPTSLQALHIAAHLDAIESTIIPALSRGECIVLDRYWWSTWVYGCVEGVHEDILEALVTAEQSAWGRWRPDCVFYITRRAPLRPESLERWQCVKAAYEGLLISEQQKYPVEVLNNEGGFEQTVDKAISRALALLP